MYKNLQKHRQYGKIRRVLLFTGPHVWGGQRASVLVNKRI